ncbi:MAG: hypothetical protein AB7I27_01690 [Bacteriovoracaceae bacterium]
MIHLALLFFTFLSILSAKELKYIYGSACADLIKERNEICDWKKQIDTYSTATHEALCISLRNGRKKINIQSCLPSFARDYQEKKLLLNGPNCWGTAMSFHGVSNKPRFIWPEEVNYWLESPLCRKLLPKEKLNPGDIINTYGPEYTNKADLLERDAGYIFWEILYPNRFTMALEDEYEGYTGYHRILHSVTYISNNLVFGKDSPAKEDPFYFQPLNEVYGRSTNPDCQENQSLSPYLREYQKPPKNIRNSKCDYLSIAYRCGNLNTFLEKKDLSKIKELQLIQDKIFELMFKKKNLSKAELIQIEQLAKASLNFGASELQKHPSDKEDEMLYALEYFTAASILKALVNLKTLYSTN